MLFCMCPSSELEFLSDLGRGPWLSLGHVTPCHRLRLKLMCCVLTVPAALDRTARALADEQTPNSKFPPFASLFLWHCVYIRIPPPSRWQAGR